MITMELVNFTGPKIIGYFSVDDDQNISKDFSQLKYLCNIPKESVDLDLRHSVPGVVNDYIGDKKQLSLVLEYFKDNRNIFNIYDKGNISLEDASFVCTEKSLRNVASSCFWLKHWSISACLFRGVIYFAVQDEKEIEEENKSPVDIKKFFWWGKKLDQYLLTDNPSNDPNIYTPVELNAGFWNIHDTVINNHRIIYGVIKEAICFTKGAEPLFNSSFVPEKVAIEKLEKAKFTSLKTAKIVKNVIQGNTKCFDWWVHLQLSGEETLFCALRPGKRGIVNYIQQFSKNDIPKLNNQLGPNGAVKIWDPNAAVMSWDSFLSFVKKCFSEQIQEQGFKNINNIRNLPMMELIFEGPAEGNFRSVPIPTQDYISVLPQSYVESFPPV